MEFIVILFCVFCLTLSAWQLTAVNCRTRHGRWLKSAWFGIFLFCSFHVFSTVFCLYFQLCISLNNIFHITNFLDQIPDKLAWEAVTQRMSVKHEDCAVGERAFNTLRELLGTTKEDILLQGTELLRRITGLMAVDLETKTKLFTQKLPNKMSVSLAQISSLRSWPISWCIVVHYMVINKTSKEASFTDIHTLYLYNTDKVYHKEKSYNTRRCRCTQWISTVTIAKCNKLNFIWFFFFKY